MFKCSKEFFDYSIYSTKDNNNNINNYNYKCRDQEEDVILVQFLRRRIRNKNKINKKFRKTKI